MSNPYGSEMTPDVHVKLGIVLTPDDESTVIRFAMGGAVIPRDHEAHLLLDCGNCGALIIRYDDTRGLKGRVLYCGNCGGYNQIP